VIAGCQMERECAGRQLVQHSSFDSRTCLLLHGINKLRITLQPLFCMVGLVLRVP
jgi:hypothetical protein